MRNKLVRQTAAFTLIELLIVVAIIAILAAIAVPNFLEAQTRSKIARAKADCRTIELAIQSYVVDHNTDPATIPNPGFVPGGAAGNISWWGFCSSEITTPVAYMTTLPVMSFFDERVFGMWRNIDPATHSQDNQPYTYLRNTSTPSSWKVGTLVGNNDIIGKHVITQDFHDQVIKSGFIIYTCGPDRQDSTVWGVPVIYDPTNGTMSFGDVHRFGAGENKDDRWK